MGRPRQDVSIYQIAREVGVSASTVSRVMNNRVGVGEDIRGKINTLLSKYNFTANYPIVRPPKIAFVISDADSSGYLLRAVSGIDRHAQISQIDYCLIFSHNEDSESLLRQLRDQQCSGVIIGMGEDLKNAQAVLAGSGLPVIFLDTTVNEPKLGFIDNDSYAGSCSATKHLLELGHRKIGYLLHFSGKTVFDHQQRYQGYEDTMRQAGIKIEPDWVINGLPTDNTSRGAVGLITMRQLLEQAPELTAVLAIDDAMALGAVTAIHQSGRKIPQDISIVGFDNYADTENWYPALTTVDHPIEQAGAMAAEAIEQALKNPGAWTPLRTTLKTRLIIRESTGPCPV
jgi:DNA-binding LacI/PurR family transcriptional regulator